MPRTMPFAHYANSLRNRKEHMPQLSALRPVGTPRGGTDTAGSKNFCICTSCWSRNVRRRRRQLFCKNSAGCWKSHSVMRAGRDRSSPPTCCSNVCARGRRNASRSNKAPASDPRHRTAAGGTRSVPSSGRSHESEDRITAKNKTRCRVLFFCLTPNVRRRSCRKGYFRAARPGRRAS